MPSTNEPSAPDLDKNKLGDSGKGSPETPHEKWSFLNWIASVLKLIKSEALVGILALILSLGQYFQSVISIRINITSIWREGYTAENRDRVAKFRLYYKLRTDKCKKELCHNSIDESLFNLISSEALFRKDFIRGDEFIRELVSDDIALVEIERKLQGEKKSTNESVINNDDYIRAALKYRNAIIESLNTAEAVKAVIRSRPLPFRSHLLYSDTLEGRYNDIIEELKIDLGGFIRVYRNSLPPRETPAWFVLTNEESNRNDYYVIGSHIYVFFLILTIVYLLKKQLQRNSNKHPRNSDNQMAKQESSD